MNEKKAPKIPAKWLVVIIFALVAYGLGQPVANRKLGLKLPSLASLLGYQDSADSDKIRPPTIDDTSTNRASDVIDQPDAKQSSKASDSRKSTDAAQPPAPEAKVQDNSDSIKVGPASANKSGSTKPATTKPPTGTADKLLYGLLRETGNEDYLSPAGLRFTRGSEEGHRLKHLAKHLEDQPDRPGKHGVFYGDMPQVLKWLDEAYGRASAGAKGTSKREEEERTVYEVNFSKPIGYIGGRDGARQKNPDSKRLRMVVEGNRLITAFPF
jgi:hypothetical protein